MIKKGISLILFFTLFIFTVSAHSTNLSQEFIAEYARFYVDEITDVKPQHELTIFIIKSAAPLDWSSPSNLYRSLKKSYIKTIFNRQCRYLGHMFFSLNTSLLPQPLWVGIVASDKKEMSKQLYGQKVGLGILGHHIQSKIENQQELEKELLYHMKKNQVKAITFSISEMMTKRILNFLSSFLSKNTYGYSSSDFYGAMLYPLYEGEGAGCSDLCMAVLEASGVQIREKDSWKIKVNIPMDIIGGEYNNGIKVPIRKVKKTNNWCSENGILNKDFVEFEIYDPNLVFQWVDKRIGQDSTYHYYLNNTASIPTLYFDYSQTQQPNDSIVVLKKRTEIPLLLKVFYEKIK